MLTKEAMICEIPTIKSAPTGPAAMGKTWITQNLPSGEVSEASLSVTRLAPQPGSKGPASPSDWR